MSRPALGAALACGLLVGAVAGCSAVKEAVDADTARLERFKELHAAGDVGAIADATIACEATTAVCRQLRLIRGDACFALAERGARPRDRYACAIRELSAGLDGSAEETAAIGPLAPFEERLLEALRERQDLARSRAEAAPFTAALAARAARFRSERPEHPAGPYFAASARLTEILNGIAAGSAGASTCAELDAVLRALAKPRRAGTYARRYSRLAGDVEGARRAVPECAP